MNQDIKEKWLKALRSRKFKRGQNRLKRGEKYCCLGVLCELHRQETGGKWGEGIADGLYKGHAWYLPNEVVEWSGIGDRNPAVPYDKVGRKEPLGFLNDRTRVVRRGAHKGDVVPVYSFKDIAKFIEEGIK